MFKLLSFEEAVVMCNKYHIQLYDTAYWQDVAYFTLITKGMMNNPRDLPTGLVDQSPKIGYLRTDNLVIFNATTVCRLNENVYSQILRAGFHSELRHYNWLELAQATLRDYALDTLMSDSVVPTKTEWALDFMKRYHSGELAPYLESV